MKLKVGMYVRTTYGIGRIKKGYIVYGDDGSLWHLSYMTDNPKIEVAIYTKESPYKLFGKIQDNHNIKYEPLENNLNLVRKVYEQKLEDVVCYVPTNYKNPRSGELFYDHKFIKASFNLIDLIEVGDYVNGSPVCLIQEDEKNRKWIYTDSNYKCGYLEEDIESIVTKEQFSSMQYKVNR